jgi:hypothetical protein
VKAMTMALALLLGLAYVWLTRRHAIEITIDVTDSAGDYGLIDAWPIGRTARHIH